MNFKYIYFLMNEKNYNLAYKWIGYTEKKMTLVIFTWICVVV